MWPDPGPRCCRWPIGGPNLRHELLELERRRTGEREAVPCSEESEAALAQRKGRGHPTGHRHRWVLPRVPLWERGRGEGGVPLPFGVRERRGIQRGAGTLWGEEGASLL